MSQTVDLINKFESFYGIPLYDNKILCNYLQNRFEKELKEYDEDEVMDFFTFDNILYELDGSLQTEPEATPDQSPYIFVAHLCGLLQISSNPFFSKMTDSESFRVDLYELGKTGTINIYYWDHDEFHSHRNLSYKMFSSIDEYIQCKYDFYKLERLQVPENDAEEKIRLDFAQEYSQKYPGLVNWFLNKFKDMGCKEQVSFKSELNSDLKNAIYGAAYFATLYGSINATKPENLTMFENKTNGFSEKYPPHRLLNLFALHHKGRKDDAIQAANGLIHNNDGVPLLEKWGKRYLDGHDFFRRIGDH